LAIVLSISIGEEVLLDFVALTDVAFTSGLTSDLTSGLTNVAVAPLLAVPFLAVLMAGDSFAEPVAVALAATAVLLDAFELSAFEVPAFEVPAFEVPAFAVSTFDFASTFFASIVFVAPMNITFQEEFVFAWQLKLDWFCYRQSSDCAIKHQSQWCV
jgi:hypothetical protein